MREDLGEARVHPRPVEGGAAALAGRLDDLLLGPAGRVGMVGVAMVAGHPVRGGDDVDPGLEDLLVQVHVGKDAVEGDAVGAGGDDLADGAGGRDAQRGESDDLPGVPSDLVGRVAVQSDQLQVRLVLDASDHLGTDVARGNLEHPQLAVAHCTHAFRPIGVGRRAG